MRIIALTDLHGMTEPVSRIGRDLERADLVLLAGDLTHFGGAEEAARVVEAVQVFNTQVLAVPGNCDRPEAAEWLTGRGINLHACHRVVDDLAFVGAGGSLPCPSPTPFEIDDGELEAGLWRALQDLDPYMPFMLLSHQPPHGTACDRLASGDHAGSPRLRYFIEESAPLLVFTGHIHEARAMDRIDRTTVVNPGPLSKGSYAFAEVSREGVDRVEIRRFPEEG